MLILLTQLLVRVVDQLDCMKEEEEVRLYREEVEPGNCRCMRVISRFKSNSTVYGQFTLSPSLRHAPLLFIARRFTEVRMIVL